MQRREHSRHKPPQTNPDPQPRTPQAEPHREAPEPKSHLNSPQPGTNPEIPATTEAPKPTANLPSPNPTLSETQATYNSPIPELQPNDINFPQLNSPGSGKVHSGTQSQTTQQPGTPQTFIWRQKPDTQSANKVKGKSKVVESTPLTRQGYRLGRLAEDFWEVLHIPGTPTAQKKKLRVISFISKNQAHMEYLVDKCNQTFTPITVLHIAEVLAGVPWNANRVKHHIVNELAQALHKILIFNNQHSTTIHKWKQSYWFSHWTEDIDGEHTCTLYANIAVPKSKIKLRKGREIGWRKIPAPIQTILSSPSSEEIRDVEINEAHWQAMTGLQGSASRTQPHTEDNPAARNSFAVLSEEEVLHSS